MTEVFAEYPTQELELIPMPEWNFDDLPLVTIVVGDGLGEFEALYDHLEEISKDPIPKQQSLIVARPEIPDVLYHTLRARTADMPHVHIRKLGDKTSDCDILSHETGTFFVTRRKKKGFTQ